MPPQVAGSPALASAYRPCRYSRLPPCLASLSWKLSTPAMASEPYCAAAPSRSSSTCRTAMAGMVEMSGPCEPSDRPLPSHAMTAPRWRRLPLTRISMWSGARLRKFIGRIAVAASEIGCVLTLNEGASTRTRSAMSDDGCARSCSAVSTSTGTGERVTVGRPWLRRVPTTTTSSVRPYARSSPMRMSVCSEKATSMSTSVSVNPGMLAASRQGPGRTAPNANLPAPSVVATAGAPSPDAASTMAPGRARPCWSTTVPASREGTSGSRETARRTVRTAVTRTSALCSV